jgi:5'-phosphate synthase pdxT subunit
MHAVFIRAPWVESVGPAVEVLGLIEVLAGVGRSSPASHSEVSSREASSSETSSSETSSSGASTNEAPAGEGQGARPAAAGKIVAVRQGSLVATSFHPELTGDHRVHQYFIDLVRATT